MDAHCDRIAEAQRNDAVEERWRRRQFYLDEEEGMTKPPGYTEPDSSDEEDLGDSPPPPAVRTGKISPRRRSMQSRSSSKVRFDDSAIDTDYETRSNTSARSIPMNERWGEFELGEAETDIGKNVLYQAVQQGFNELLDGLFKDKEDLFSEARHTRNDRHKYLKEWQEFERACIENEEAKDEASRKADRLRTEELLQGGQPTLVESPASPPGASASPAVGVCEPFDTEATGDIPDPDDHIELMFGSTSRISAPGVSVSNTQEEETASESSYRDPTLPQFRPNEENQMSSSEASTSTVKSNPFAGDRKDAEALSALWRSHDAIDDEADRRGGYGKLNFLEFCQRMVPQDEVGNALGRKTRERRGTGEEDTWESSADLGRLAFVGTWLEMASF
jgi:hypothetical protein